MKVEAADDEARRGSELGGEDRSLIEGLYDGLLGVPVAMSSVNQ